MSTYMTGDSGNNAATTITNIGSGIAGGAATGAVAGPPGAMIGAVAGGIFATLGTIFGSDPQGPSMHDKELPPAYELQMLKEFENSLKLIQESYGKFDQISREYVDRIDLIDAGLANQIPSDQLQKQLAESSARIALGLGQNAEELVKNGFLTADDIADLQKVRELDGASLDDLVSAAPEIDKGRKQLEQELARNGVSPAARAMALQDFTMNATDVVRNRRFQDMEVKSNLRNQGFSQTMGTQQALASELGRIQNVYGMRSQLSSEKFATQAGAQMSKLSLSDAAMQRYERLGKFKLSDRTREALDSGQVGPGSFNQQAGITARPGVYNANGLATANTVSNIGSMSDRAIMDGMQLTRRVQSQSTYTGTNHGATNNYASYVREATKRGLM
jgi:hypothetical protein